MQTYGFRKSVMVEATKALWHGCSDKTLLIIINTDRGSKQGTTYHF